MCSEVACRIDVHVSGRGESIVGVFGGGGGGAVEDAGEGGGEVGDGGVVAFSELEGEVVEAGLEDVGFFVESVGGRLVSITGFILLYS